MILVAVKNLNLAKQRLAAILDQPARTALAQAMIHDVFDAIAACRLRPAVAVVTGDRFTMDLARTFEFEVIRDDANLSQTAAIEMATCWCLARGADSTLTLPGDIPLMQPGELDEILAVAPFTGSVLVPASDGRGTNAVYRKPANLFPLRFGNESFTPHLHVARDTGRPCVVLSLDGIGFDVDRPADVQRLIDAPGQTRAQRLARQWGVRQYPLAVNR
ncbi:MAG: 2-phospho-L-lactate guanylyltransferase [Acidobacteria bacterium]|nr:2-phospho-L-lactate guanylyltransferase [Acidobacteriota bacterium]